MIDDSVFSKAKMFHNSLFSHLIIPNNSQRVSQKGKERDLSRGGGERRDGDPSYFSLARALLVRPSSFPVPFRRPDTVSDTLPDSYGRSS